LTQSFNNWILRDIYCFYLNFIDSLTKIVLVRGMDLNVISLGIMQIIFMS
jgi:hypothetical protein